MKKPCLTAFQWCSLLGAALWSSNAFSADGERVFRRVNDSVEEIWTADGWTTIVVRVVQVIPGRRVLAASSGENYCAVQNAPENLVEDDVELLRAKWIGTFEYPTVFGPMATVPLFDCGTAAEDPRETARREKERADALKAMAEQDRIREESALLAVERDRRYCVWLLSQATNGSAWAQFEVGCRLRDGRGFKVDLKEALAWFLRSHSNGHSPASIAASNLTARFRSAVLP